MKIRIVYFINIIFLSLPFFLEAQSYSFRKYSVDDGLPSSYLYDIIQDDKGFIWLSTESGLCKFDGTTFFSNPIPELASDEIINMMKDSKGRIWMALLDGKIVCHDDNSTHIFERFEVNSSGKSFKFQLAHIDEDHNGKIWIMSKLKSAIRIDSFIGNQIIEKTEYPFPYNSARMMDVIQDTSYILGLRGIWKVTDNNKEYKKFNIDYKILNPSFSLVHNNKIYFCDRSKIYKYDPSSHHLEIIFSEYDQYFKKGITTLYVDEKENFWINTKNGVLILKKQLDDTYIPQQILNENFIGLVFEDRDKNIWITTQKNGLFFISSTQINVIDKKQNLSSNMMTSLELDNNGNLIAGCDDNSYNVLSLKENNEPKIIYKNKLTKINLEIYDVLSHQDGSVWYASSGGLFITKNSTSSNAPERISKISYKVCKQANDGSIWAGGSGQAIRIVNNKFENILDERTYSVAPLSKDEAWIGTVRGLYHYTSKKGCQKVDIEVLNKDIRDLKFDNEDNLWIASKSAGLFILDKYKNIQAINTDNGLPSNSCKHIFFGEKYAWISTNKGIARISLKDGFITVIDINDGLPSKEVNNVIQKDDQVFAATNGGIAYFNQEIQTSTSQPTIEALSIRINEKDTIIQSKYQLKYNDNNIKASFTGITYQSYKDLIYNIKMEGLDEDWLLNTTGKAEYPSLAPGQYNLKIKAKTLDSAWSDIYNIEIFIDKPFWSKLWFIILSALLILILFGWITYKVNNNAKKQTAFQERLKQSQLTALRSQMNPHFMFNSLNSIQEFVLLGDKKSANKYLSKFSKLMRSILDMSDKNHIPLEKEIEALNLYLELEKMRFDGKLEYRIDVAPYLSKAKILIPSMLIQPYVENAIKHGLMHKNENRKLDVRFKSENSYIICEVEDNGIGRAAAKEIILNNIRTHQPKAMNVTEERLKLLNSAFKDKLNVEIIDLKNNTGEASGTKLIIYIQQK